MDWVFQLYPGYIEPNQISVAISRAKNNQMEMKPVQNMVLLFFIPGCIE
jgi:hypothetical protein